MEYFIDDEHLNNYELLLNRFPRADKEKFYKLAIYITSLPDIFGSVESVQHLLSDTENPYGWYFEWKDGKFDDVDAFYMSSGYVKIAELGGNLWNGDDHFNLYDSINTWSDDLYQVFVESLLLFQ